MSWSESFPILDDDMVDEFENFATAEELADLKCMYEVKRILNPQDKKHIASFSLFWKPTNATSAPYPEPTLELLKDPSVEGIKTRFNPWEHYVSPLLTETPKLVEKYGDVSVRVHLACDLEFLAEPLAAAGCEVWLMQHPSINFAPGGLWRLIPFSEEGKLITVADTDRFKYLSSDLDRTRSIDQAGLGAWRVVVPLDGGDEGKFINYRPFIGSQMGVRGGWPVVKLLQAFTWHNMRNTMPKLGALPGCGVRPIPWANWPSHYFDEWFLAAAFFPRVAETGMLTFAPASANPLFLALDVEYCTWSNPNSQLIFFPVHDCCGPKRLVEEVRMSAPAAEANELGMPGRHHLGGETTLPPGPILAGT